MKILILPGASDSNKAWADAFVNQGYEVHSFYYDHWGKEKMFDFSSESKKLSNLDGSWKNCFVVAKSIGSLLTVYAVHNKIISPIGATFMGFPSNLDGEKDAALTINLKKWLSDYLVDTHIIQNEHDPVTSFNEAREYLKEFKVFRVEKIPGDTHKYPPEICLEKGLRFMSRFRKQDKP
ncbi:MAG: hypothetical protein Q8L64_04760 [bacterium]|nr:hypothetical protein [bacterium]